ncbi:hypothetical protein [Furfurilactobacillus milii]|uniref:DUF3277 domain-containing protein n=1 Tax=Furfurilactobacillus milii TaxID=2888272 RepID=A0ABT6DCN5_9LACO|nr:hypothetical protein [Furfurilactobacillus milii]QLE67417.1 Hypothetical protein LROSL2_2067 [Furfurilactobacillus rossiae]MCF6161905.1 hypothetical protein [Furfurilactobacillus milii]MCF6164285.1 hypothetical protein [Furfurilactobacillus milii]MDF9914910.1 hypothetical protein [Furfurilactobacillus milii]QLE69846.1 Hypothetical protein LROSL3_2125 [Furfurilactobacillus rossiae]
MGQADLDLDAAVNRYIASKVDLYTKIELGNSYHTGNTLSYTTQPTGPATRYYNGIRKRAFSFAITAKHANGMVALNTISLIMSAMENATHVSIKSSNNSFKFINAKMTESATFKGTVLDDANKGSDEYSVYQGVFSVEVILI